MADRENKRTCFKCGCSPAADGVKLFRFPKPAVRNLVRCELWAKYIFPDRTPTLELQRKLHSEHRMLCQNHFKDEDFTDSSKQSLLRESVPCDVDENYVQEIIEPEAGPSHRVPFMDISNVSCHEIALTNENKNFGIVSVDGPSHMFPLVDTGSLKIVPVAGPSHKLPPVDTDSHKITVTKEDKNVPSFVGINITAGPSHSTPFVNIPNKIPETESEEMVCDIITGSSKQDKTKGNTKEDILFAKCSKYMRQTYQLRNRIKNLKRKQVLEILNEENCIKKLSSKLTPTFAILLQSQIKNHKKKLTGRRWSKEEKITALRIFKRSPTCYRLLRRMFHLPAPSTLKIMLNKVPFNVGPNQNIFDILKDYIKSQKESDNNFVLLFDEMSLKKHLYYNVKYDYIEGYQDHAGQGRSHLMASYALVFMIAGIRKRVKQPIAHYFSSGFSTADRLVVLIKEVLLQCFQAGINIAAIVCDMDGVNRRALTILGATMQQPCITVHGKEIITLFDTPHLLKCFRNLFLKYDVEYSSNISSGENVTGRGVAKWSHIREFYSIDSKNKNFVYAPALRKDHLDPNTKQKMKVKLAAQVFSHSVAGGMYSKIHRGELSADAITTANMLSDIDKLFDLVNSDQNDLRRGKPHATNMGENTPHLDFFQYMKKNILELKFVGSTRKPPSQEGWVWTLNGIESIWKKLRKHHKINRLATRRLQQDALENLFGCIRGNCGSNTNPTTGQFIAGLKTAILSSLANIGTKGNCETDNNVIINNLNKLLSVSKTAHPPDQMQEEADLATESDFITIEDVEDDIEDNAEIQACTYVCGFLISKMALRCDMCKNIFIAKEIEQHHSFVEWREYSELKKCLNYASKNLVFCVESCANFINTFLNEKGYLVQLKKTSKQHLLLAINFDFLNMCREHKEKNINFIIDNVFKICIKRFCTLQNRKFSEEASTQALKRKMKIIVHK